jgi:hypothetical protein
MLCAYSLRHKVSEPHTRLDAVATERVGTEILEQSLRSAEQLNEKDVCDEALIEQILPIDREVPTAVGGTDADGCVEDSVTGLDRVGIPVLRKGNLGASIYPADLTVRAL